MSADAQVPDEDQREEVARIRASLAEQRAHRLAGEYETTLETVRQLAAQSEATAYWPLQAETLLLQGMLEEDLSRFETAADTLEKAIFAAQAGGADRVAAETFVRLVRFAAYEQGDIARADYLSRLSGGLLQRLDQHQHLEADLADHRGMLETRRGRVERAIEHHRQALELRRPIDNSVERSRTLVRLGTALKFQGDFEAARGHLEQAARELETSLGPLHPKVAAALDQLGVLELDLGDYQGAQKSFERALSIYERVFGANNPRTAPSLLHLGAVSFHLGEIDTAMTHFMRSAEIIERAFGKDHPNMAVATTNIGLTLTDLGDEEQALLYLERAHEIHLNLYGGEHWLTAHSLYNLGETWNHFEDFGRALELHRQAVDLWEKTLGEGHYLLAHGLFGLGRSLVGLGRFQEATEALERALELWPGSGRDPVYEAETRFELAKARWALGEAEGSLELATQARSLFANASAKFAPALAEVEMWIAERS